MYSILIVDDERIVRLALNSIIDWEKEGFRVAASVSSAQAALEHIRRQPPHLVITDIVMPEMDGLALVEQARSEGYEGQFVLLTNHQDFSYAVQALKHGVLDYVLKTDLAAESFSKVLARVRQQLEAHPMPSLPAHGDAADTDLQAIARCLSQPDCKDFSCAPHFLLQVFLRGELGGQICCSPTATLKNIVADLLKLDAAQTVSLSRTCVAVIFAAQYAGDLLNGLPARLDRLRERVRLYMNSDCAFVLSQSFSGKQQLLQVLEGCAGVRRQVIYEGFGCLLRQDAARRCRPAKLSPGAIFHPIQACIEQGDYAGAQARFEEFWASCRDREVPPQEASAASTALQNLLLINNSLWVERAAQNQDESPRRLFFPCTMQEHIRYFSELLAMIRQARENFSLASCRDEIRQLDDFIHAHISEHITLAMLSRQVNMTENYLSRMFKSETGLNIVAYINLVKLEHARTLLSQPGSSIKSVALELGFEEASYFNKLFNKAYGINPSDYKKLVQRQG